MDHPHFLPVSDAGMHFWDNSDSHSFICLEAKTNSQIICRATFFEERFGVDLDELARDAFVRMDTPLDFSMQEQNFALTLDVLLIQRVTLEHIMRICGTL